MIASSSPSPGLNPCPPHYASERRHSQRSVPSPAPAFTGRQSSDSSRMDSTSTAKALENPSSTTKDASTQWTPPRDGSSHQSPSNAKRKSRSPQSDAKPQHSSTGPKKACSLSDAMSLSSSSTSSSKRRAIEQPVRAMPALYESCDVADLVRLISSMLMELIRFNDEIPLADGNLTRFHSRSPPSISVHDYLQRLTVHATLSPPILLSMVYYIDRMCALCPTFTISSLTVHRFLIASATVASKGLSDSFWTNNTYARVGGVSLKELALLELELLKRVEWRIVPKAEVLVDYYRSLVERSDGFKLETQET